MHKVIAGCLIFIVPALVAACSSTSASEQQAGEASESISVSPLSCINSQANGTYSGGNATYVSGPQYENDLCHGLGVAVAPGQGGKFLAVPSEVLGEAQCSRMTLSLRTYVMTLPTDCTDMPAPCTRSPGKPILLSTDTRTGHWVPWLQPQCFFDSPNRGIDAGPVDLYPAYSASPGWDAQFSKVRVVATLDEQLPDGTWVAHPVQIRATPSP